MLLASFLIILSCASPRIEGAKIHIRDGRYEQAEELLRAEIKENPKSADAHFYLAEALLHLRKYKESAKFYYSAMELDSAYLSKIKRDSVVQYRVWGGLHYGASEFAKEEKVDSAIIFLKKAIEVDSTKWSSYAILGWLYVQTGEYNKAKEIGDALFKLRKDSPEAYFILGKIAIKKENWETAKDNFKNSRLFLEKELEEMKKEAVKKSGEKLDVNKVLEITKGLKIEATKQKLIENMRMSEKEAGEVSQWLHRYRAKEMELARALHWEGKTYIQLKDYTKADSVLTKVIEIDPDNIDAYYDLGEVRHRTENHKEAVEMLEKVIKSERYPEDFYLYLLAGVSYCNLKNYDKAEEYLLKSKTLKPDNPETYQKLSVLYKDKGDKKKSEEFLRKYIEMIKEE